VIHCEALGSSPEPVSDARALPEVLDDGRIVGHRGRRRPDVIHCEVPGSSPEPVSDTRALPQPLDDGRIVRHLAVADGLAGG